MISSFKFAVRFNVTSCAYTYLLTYLLTHSLTHSIQHNPSWKGNRSLASQEIPRILWNPKIYYCIYKCSQTVPNLKQINPFHGPPSHFLKIHLNFIFPFMSGFSKCSLSCRIPLQTLYTPLLSPYVLHATASYSSWLDHPNNIWWGHRSLSFSLCTLLHSPLHSNRQINPELTHSFLRLVFQVPLPATFPDYAFSVCLIYIMIGVFPFHVTLRYFITLFIMRFSLPYSYCSLSLSLSLVLVNWFSNDSVLQIIIKRNKMCNEELNVNRYTTEGVRYSRPFKNTFSLSGNQPCCTIQRVPPYPTKIMWPLWCPMN